MANAEGRPLVAAIREVPVQKPPTEPIAWQEYFRSDMQPTTTMMLVAVLMIVYSRVVGA